MTTLIPAELVDAVAHNHWLIDTIEAIQQHVPLSEKTKVLVTWKDTSWNVNDAHTSGLMDAKVFCIFGIATNRFSS